MNKILRKIYGWIEKLFTQPAQSVAEVAQEPTPSKGSIFTTDTIKINGRAELYQSMTNAIAKTFQKKPPVAVTPGATMDSSVKYAMDNVTNMKSEFYSTSIPSAQVLWYASQSFIGYQLCAMISQHWLVSKACSMPAEDAVRNGYEVTINDGTEVSNKVLDAIRQGDAKYNINKNMIEFLQKGRIFGIRIAMFIVESEDPEYYQKPFNVDGVKPGTYKGISQIDPYWITPQLDDQAAGNPASMHFYEPTWWYINGKLIHRTHLIIFRTEELPDILKPTYIYGGVSIPQKIYERVYAAERTANEAPMLALTKRTDVITADMTEALANQSEFDRRMAIWAANRDNYGVKTLSPDEKMEQFDTSLQDLDNVIMTQYQLVAAIANVPAVKLLGTSPKGFNATGEYEESNYHEMLESLQTGFLQMLLDRHHLLMIASDIAPQFGMKPFNVTVSFNPLDALTAREQAEINKLKAETGQTLMASGAIDGIDERNRVINDPDSGYTGMDEEMPEQPEDEPQTEVSEPEGA